MGKAFYLDSTNILKPGDILISRMDWWHPVHLLVAATTRSQFVHASLYIGDGWEWSVEAFGSRLRRSPTDNVWIYRPLQAEAAIKAVELALANPVTGYNWSGAVWTGVRAAETNRSALHRPSTAKYCFEAVTDVYAKCEYDLVPRLDDGAVLGKDIVSSDLLVRL